MRIFVSAFAVLILGGCHSVPRDAGFSDVKRRIDERLAKEISWQREKNEETTDAQRVELVLQGEFTVESAVQLALLNNRRLQATYEMLGIAQAEVVQASLMANPRFDGRYLPPVSGTPAATAGLDLASNFLQAFLIPLRRKVAKAEFESAKDQVSLKIIEMAFSVRESVLEYQAAEQALTISKARATAGDLTLAAAQKMFEAGTVNRLNVVVERSQQAQAKLAEAQAQGRLSNSRERLNRLMGLNASQGQAWKMAGKIADVPPDEIDSTNLEDRAIAASLAMSAGRHHVEALAKRRGITNWESTLSEVELGIAAEREDDTIWHVGPSLGFQIPIFDQGQAKRARARAEFRQALAQHAALATELRSRTRQAVLRLNLARQTAILWRDSILPIRREVVKQTELQQNAMQVGVFQLLEAKRDQLEAESSSLEAFAEYWKARSAVEALLAGAGSDAQLELPAAAGADKE